MKQIKEVELHDSHVQCFERFKDSIQDAHVKCWEEQKAPKVKSLIIEATLAGAKAALAEDPDSKYLKEAVIELEKMLAGPLEGDLPSDSASLWSMRPMD